MGLMGLMGLIGWGDSEKINYVDGRFGGGQHVALVRSLVGAALGTVVALEVGIDITQAQLGLDVPSVGEHPRVAVEEAGAPQVALMALTLQVGGQAEGDVHVARIVVGIEQVDAHRVAGKG